MIVQNVLLDLDGTLTDPALGITNCIAYALERLDVAAPAVHDLHFAIGPPLRGTFATLLGNDDTALIERAMGFYRERFAEVGLFENLIYEGVPEMLVALNTRNFRVLLATAKPHVYARRILAHFDIHAAFEGIYGSELDGVRQHKGELLAYLFTCEGINPQSAVMVGDRHHDIDAARANGCRAIGVTYGYGRTEELAHADQLCGSPAHLTDIVTRMDAQTDQLQLLP
jgi:phosphoglycolate phosphatase